MTGILALIAFLEMLIYTKKRCFLKAICISVLGAILAWLLFPKIGLVLPLTKQNIVLFVLLGLPGVLLLCLGKSFLPLL